MVSEVWHWMTTDVIIWPIFKMVKIIILQIYNAWDCLGQGWGRCIITLHLKQNLRWVFCLFFYSTTQIHVFVVLQAKYHFKNMLNWQIFLSPHLFILWNLFIVAIPLFWIQNHSMDFCWTLYSNTGRLYEGKHNTLMRENKSCTHAEGGGTFPF